MEHIIQFGVTIDDDKIEKMVMEKASHQCMKRINDSIIEFTNRSCYRDSELKKIFKEEVKKVVDDNKGYIVEEVIKEVSKNMMKTKAFLEAKQKIIDELEVE